MSEAEARGGCSVLSAATPARALSLLPPQDLRLGAASHVPPTLPIHKTPHLRHVSVYSNRRAAGSACQVFSRSREAPGVVRKDRNRPCGARAAGGRTESPAASPASQEQPPRPAALRMCRGQHRAARSQHPGLRERGTGPGKSFFIGRTGENQMGRT